jgi:hypothetical protein
LERIFAIYDFPILCYFTIELLSIVLVYSVLKPLYYFGYDVEEFGCLSHNFFYMYYLLVNCSFVTLVVFYFLICCLIIIFSNLFCIQVSAMLNFLSAGNCKTNWGGRCSIQDIRHFDRSMKGADRRFCISRTWVTFRA